VVARTPEPDLYGWSPLYAWRPRALSFGAGHPGEARIKHFNDEAEVSHLEKGKSFRPKTQCDHVCSAATRCGFGVSYGHHKAFLGCVPCRDLTLMRTSPSQCKRLLRRGMAKVAQRCELLHRRACTPSSEREMFRLALQRNDLHSRIGQTKMIFRGVPNPSEDSLHRRVPYDHDQVHSFIRRRRCCSNIQNLCYNAANVLYPRRSGVRL
jgi:hypothetical protein